MNEQRMVIRPKSLAQLLIKLIGMDSLRFVQSPANRTLIIEGRAGEKVSAYNIAHRELHFLLCETDLEGVLSHSIRQVGKHLTGNHDYGIDLVPGILPQVDSQVYREAIERSPFDLSQCKGCNKPTVCLPDGLPYCEQCGREGG